MPLSMVQIVISILFDITRLLPCPCSPAVSDNLSKKCSVGDGKNDTTRRKEGTKKEERKEARKERRKERGREKI